MGEGFLLNFDTFLYHLLWCCSTNDNRKEKNIFNKIRWNITFLAFCSTFWSLWKIKKKNNNGSCVGMYVSHTTCKSHIFSTLTIFPERRFNY